MSRFVSQQQAPSPAASPAFVSPDEFATSPWIGWWYRLTTTPPPRGRIATLREREIIRRSRLACVILAVQLFGIELPVIPIVANAPNGHIVLPWLVGCLLALLAAFVCNRRGHLTLAGLLMVTSIEVTVGIKILTVPGGLTILYLPQFDILVQPILIAVALLAPWSAFVVAAANVGFVLAVLTIAPHAPDLAAALQNPAAVGDIFSVPIMGQILAAFFGWLIVKNLLKALKRASQAEQVALLEHHIAQSRAEAEARSQRLTEGITAIVATIQQVSNQQSQARIQLPTTHDLWPLAQQINNFLDRYRFAREAVNVLDHLQHTCNGWADEIHQARLERRAWRLPAHHDRSPLTVVIDALGTSPSQSLPAGSSNEEWLFPSGD